MPTPAERIATLETIVAENRRLIDGLRSDIHSGPGVEWAQSIRGRLHHMQSAIEAADKLADAARLLAREQANTRQHRIKTWQWSVIAAAAIVSAASPYVLILVR
jgi:hypothetical protein